MSEGEKNPGTSLWFRRWEEGEGKGEGGTWAQFDPVIGDLGNMSLGSHLQKKLKELHIPIPQEANRRQGTSSECAVPVHASGEGIHQEAWRQKSLTQPKCILNSSPCCKLLNFRQKILLLVVKKRSLFQDITFEMRWLTLLCGVRGDPSPLWEVWASKWRLWISWEGDSSLSIGRNGSDFVFS